MIGSRALNKIATPAVNDLLHESFHEHRPSFRSIVSKFDAGSVTSKGSFSVASNRSIRKMLRQNKSIRTQGSKTSFVSSISSGLGFISEDEDDGSEPEAIQECDEECEEESKPEATKVVERFDQQYTLGEELGAGAYAVVKEGTHTATGRSYAIKIVEVDNMDEFDLDALEIEISVMGDLSHPNIVRLYHTIKEANFYYLVTEKMVGGELLDRIVQKTFYNEKEARDTCVILFKAMDYCHKQGIAHRDLKPENLLLTSMDNDSDLKIADFGFAKLVPKSGLKTMCGTPGYVAPEILERTAYGTQCDMWSLGVIVYILLGGYSPFEEQSQAVLFQKIRDGDYTFHEEFWGPVSHDAKDFIEKLLVVNPKNRLTAGKALKHKWMMASGDVLASQDLGANLTELKRFSAKRKFKAAVKTIIATQKLSSLF